MLKLDLKASFQKIGVRSANVEKTAFKTHYGHLQLLVTPMEPFDAPATFQSLMNTLFSDCVHQFLVIYLDYSSSIAIQLMDFYHHLGLVLSRLLDIHLFISTSKCYIATSKIASLALRVRI